MVIGIPVPHNYLMPLAVVKSLVALEGKYKIFFSEGPYVYENRNGLIALAKLRGEDLLMIDSDIVFYPDHVERVECFLETSDAIIGVYALSNGFAPLFERIDGDYRNIQPPTSLESVAACGGGFLGLSKKLIQELPENPCNNVFESSMHGEDISLCYRIGELGFNIWCDPQLSLGHVRSNILYYESQRN